MVRVICVSAGQFLTKKENNSINRRNQYLNYGLLSLASVLRRNGLHPIVIHGGFSSPNEILQIAKSNGLCGNSPTILVSIPSFYAVPWAKEFILNFKSDFPFGKVIVGGRWVVGGQPEFLKGMLPGSDIVVSGLGEKKILDLVDIEKSQLSKNVQPLNERPFLDYTLLYKRKLYQPSIEIARGCGMGCNFCQERSEKLQPLKNPELLADELRSALLRDELVEMTPYFETSMFVPNENWVKGLCDSLEKREIEVKWRTEARVDTVNPSLIPALAKCGLSVIDLGLESAAPMQLSRMGKTKDSLRYLERASKLLIACSENNIKVKVNLLLYAGENEGTVSQTLAWMDLHRDLIYGVSVGPVIAFGWGAEAEFYLNSLGQYGATKAYSPCAGVTYLNLSESMSYEKSMVFANMIRDRYMDRKNFYDLKSFSYFPRDYFFEDFCRDVSLG